MYILTWEKRLFVIYTITRESELLPTERQKEAYNRVRKDVTERNRSKVIANDTLTARPDNQKNSWNTDRKASLKAEQQKTYNIPKPENNLPELTISNL